ncbi:MAG: (2Fe-2S) ferredoxin domain-containing protein [Candidatus Hydrogenedentes bacterium]|nr:(2Fe-2S) ferredoxin domain-containing protein [Candidatus Hydrogenedentota bacterium]
MTTPATVAFDALAKRCEDTLKRAGGEAAIRIQVGSATCEHAAGALEVYDEFRKHIKASGRSDIQLHRTGCTGRCSREPIVGVLVPGRMPIKYERVDRERVHEIFTSHIQEGATKLDYILDGPVEKLYKHELLFCSNVRCCGGKHDWQEVFRAAIATAGLNVDE